MNGHSKHDELQEDMDLSFVKDLIFDSENKYLIGYGGTSFFMLDLTDPDGDNRLKKYKIKDTRDTKFESILHMQFKYEDYRAETSTQVFIKCFTK